MKVRDLAVQGALAAVALVAAFLVWQREPEGAPGEVTVVDAPARALDLVRYEDEARFVELFRDAKDRDQLWVRLGYKPPKPVPVPAASGAADGGVVATPGADAGTAVAAAGADAGTAPVQVMANTEPPPPPRELRANDVAEKLFAKFAPLRAMRSLGELDAKKLEEVGLTSTQRKLTVTVGGKAQDFSLASPAGGWGTPYLKREADGRVFLLGPALLPDLENATSRLVDRRLHTFDLGEFDEVVITAAGASRTFTASGKAPGPVNLMPKESPDRPDEFARNWHDRVWRLMPLDFLGRGEQPPGGEPEESFRVEYRRDGKPLGEVRVARGNDGFYVRTEHTTGWARLHSGVDNLATEAAKVTAQVSSSAGK
ncbi:hypothetical protein HPC49_41405 [Pyxidicoccus fallax]|uniref:DUF4340 domain-containing protein n=1 Tax=Pyxidicoccus fallax TaxID=394095 RepID=A0A848LNN4_9BACT|nr:hypothetical protein [Pyxidicoccus fallax]NMO19289.1 hypothetical protein [Pyxidicoccus fallax]NPC84661.1 hypothetical protein [Pyxidicoccus fallax]